MLDDLDLSLQKVSQRYQQGLCPMDVIDGLLGKIKPSDPAWISLMPREELLVACDAIERRRAAGESLPLFGVPFGVKDNIDVRGLPTTAACPALQRVPAKSAHAVSRLEEAGAICLGKTNLDQFATGLCGVRSPYGACHSVGNREFASGGSSSGSAVAVAAGHVSFALGTDTGGSGRVPAGFNGIVGIKPTPGRVSTSGVVPNCPSLDCVSVFARSVADGSEILRIMEGFDPVDPFSKREEEHSCRPQRERQKVRFGVLPADRLETFGMDECKEFYRRAVMTFEELGLVACEVDFEPFEQAGRLLFNGPWVAERSLSIASMIDNTEHLLDVTRTVLEGTDAYDAMSVFSGMHSLMRLKRAVGSIFEPLDFLLLPTAPRPYKIAELENSPINLNSNLGYYTYFANLLDLCAVSVPSGVLSCRVPMGVTLYAPAWFDRELAQHAEKFMGGVSIPSNSATARPRRMSASG